jgi:hypothetical protein
MNTGVCVCGGTGVGFWSLPLYLLRGSEDVQEVGLSGWQLGVRGILDPIFEGVLSEPVTDGLQAVSLLAEPLAAFLGILLGLPTWQLHDPESYLGMSFWLEAVYGLPDGSQGFLLLYLGCLGKKNKEILQHLALGGKGGRIVAQGCLGQKLQPY